MDGLVKKPSFSDAALVLVGHGSTLNADSSYPTYLHADEIRRRRLFAQVQECFWKLEPSVSSVRRAIFAPRVFVVPLFISEGYFTEEVIPREMGFCSKEGREVSKVQQIGRQQWHYCGPVGTHDSMAEVLVCRAQSILREHPFPREPKLEETTLFIAGHGTGNNDNSRKAVERQAELIRQRKLFADCHAVFMEEDPRIEDCYTLAETKNVVMVPFFISDGLHSYEDIPVMLGEPETVVRERFARGHSTWRNPTEKRGKRIWYAPSIGNAPLIADVILERVAEAANPNVAVA